MGRQRAAITRSAPTSTMKEAVVSLVLLLLPLPNLAQLTGHRGVVSLPDNFEYRDEETRLASQRVAAFAMRVQPLTDHEAQENRLKEVQKSFGVDNETISFFTWGNSCTWLYPAVPGCTWLHLAAP